MVGGVCNHEREAFDQFENGRVYAVGFFKLVDARDVRMVQQRDTPSA